MLIRLAALSLVLWAVIHPITSLAQVLSEDDRPTVVVVLGGGGAHAIANLGVLEELERQQVQIDAIVGNERLTIEDIPRLKYARMVIEETLRLHPPFWFENRNVIEDVELGGARLKKGSLVAFSRYSLHRHADFWEDPEKFNPDRFEPEHEENSRSTYASVPFGGGPRL